MKKTSREALTWIVVVVATLATATNTWGQRRGRGGAAAQAPATQPATRTGNELVDRIREEGFNRSEVMQTLSYLTDVIGPRLTGSPNLKRANEWTRDKLISWGAESHLEA